MLGQEPRNPLPHRTSSFDRRFDDFDRSMAKAFTGFFFVWLLVAMTMIFAIVVGMVILWRNFA